MLCVIEPRYRTVWGIGKTREEAFEDAYKRIEEHKRNDPDFRLSAIEVATLRRGAPLDSGGLELWAWVIYRAPVQGELL